VPGDATIGEYLVRHPGVDKVSFTGSTSAGRLVGAICGQHLKRVSLELGGKSAAIVLDDADLEVTVAASTTGGFANSGQVCAALSRVFVSSRLHDDLVGRLAEPAAALGSAIRWRSQPKSVRSYPPGSETASRVTSPARWPTVPSSRWVGDARQACTRDGFSSRPYSPVSPTR
jgi:hypothetical protein